jgi:hypothetical protein
MMEFLIGVACGVIGLMIAARAFSPVLLPKPPKPTEADYPLPVVRGKCPVCKVAPLEMEHIQLFGKAFDACTKCGAVIK